MDTFIPPPTTDKYRIAFSDLEDLGIALHSERAIVIAEEVKAFIGEGKLRICENGKDVFHMKVAIDSVKQRLTLDYPRTLSGYEGKGWPMLATYLALGYGEHAGCTTVAAGTPIEPTGDAAGFWLRASIQFSEKGTAISTSKAAIRRWASGRKETREELTARLMRGGEFKPPEATHLTIRS